MKNILALSIALIIWTSCYAQKQKLELNLITGNTYSLNLVSNASITQNIGNQQVNMKMTIIGKLDYKVINIQDSIYNLEVKYENLAMKMALPNGEMEFSSEKNDINDIISTVLGTIKNKPFILKMTKLGRIVEVKNMDTLFFAMLDKFPQLSKVQKQQIQGQIEQAYGEKALKGNFEMISAIFSDLPVAKGDKWTINTQLESGMSANMETIYELKEINDSYCIISGDSKIETADKDVYTELNGISLKYDMSGTMFSNIKINKISGWIMDSNINQALKGTVQIKPNPQMPDGMKYQMTMNNEMIITE
jgi:hypothetical protein